MIQETYYTSPFGVIKIAANEEKIVEMGFVRTDEVKKSVDKNLPPLLIKTISQLDEYFSGTRKNFDLPVENKGTPFQERVWQEMSKVPYGTTITYKELAIRAGSPNAVRAVGNTCRINHVGIIVPCHRIVGSNGKLTGYAGGIDKKESLLTFEKSHTK